MTSLPIVVSFFSHSQLPGAFCCGGKYVKQGFETNIIEFCLEVHSLSRLKETTSFKTQPCVQTPDIYIYDWII